MFTNDVSCGGVLATSEAYNVDVFDLFSQMTGEGDISQGTKTKNPQFFMIFTTFFSKEFRSMSGLN